MVDAVLSVIVCICTTITNSNRLYAVGTFFLAVCFRRVVVSCELPFFITSIRQNE